MYILLNKRTVKLEMIVTMLGTEENNGRLASMDVIKDGFCCPCHLKKMEAMESSVASIDTKKGDYVINAHLNRFGVLCCILAT
jgi:hypothetical protein